MPARSGRLMAALGAALLLGGCRTYTPSFMPTFPPSPPPAEALYRTLHEEPLPAGLPGGVVRGVRVPSGNFVQGEGLLVPIWPAPGAPPDGLYLLSPSGTGLRPLALLTPPGPENVPTASALGRGYFAYQAGPEAGPRRAPLVVQRLDGQSVRLHLPKIALRSIYTSLTFADGRLYFIATHTFRGNDTTSAVACSLPQGRCRVLQTEESARSGLDIVLLTAAGGRIYLAIKPADPEDPGKSRIAWLPAAGGRTHVVLRMQGTLTSLVVGNGFLMFTEVVGIDDGLYLWRSGNLVRLTPPSEFPSNPSCSGRYVAWWGSQPRLLDLRTDRLYRVPGYGPQLAGGILTFLTPRGLMWLVLPDAHSQM